MTTSSFLLRDEFLSAMRKREIEPDTSISADGEMHRFRDWLDKPGTRNCWYILFPDFPPAGAFGCWRRGIHQIWTGSIQHDYTFTLAVTERVHRCLKKDFAKGRELATEMLQECVPCNGRHKYLLKKKVSTHGTYYYRGALLIPVRDVAGNLHGFQRIYGDGRKRFTQWTNKLGHFFLIGRTTDRICICEGFATGASIHEITGLSVAVAFDAGNLLHVTQVLKHHYPFSELIICADNDRYTEGNPGMTQGIRATDAVDGKMVWPRFSAFTSRGTDVNDLFCEEGAEAVLKCFSEGGVHV